jgi:hypothetical protein
LSHNFLHAPTKNPHAPTKNPHAPLSFEVSSTAAVPNVSDLKQHKVAPAFYSGHKTNFFCFLGGFFKRKM